MMYTSHITTEQPKWYSTTTCGRTFNYAYLNSLKQAIKTIVLNHKEEDHGI